MTVYTRVHGYRYYGAQGGGGSAGAIPAPYMKVFKVVRAAPGPVYGSCLYGGLGYAPGVWVEPKENWGPLAAFGSLISAETFWFVHQPMWDADLGGTWELWQATAVPSIYGELWIADHFGGRMFVKSLQFPRGTVFCAALQLERRLG